VLLSALDEHDTKEPAASRYNFNPGQIGGFLVGFNRDVLIGNHDSSISSLAHDFADKHGFCVYQHMLINAA
jgi:hypothetical protein